MRIPVLLGFLFAAAGCHAQSCAATPEAAAASIIGVGHAPSAIAGTGGYRVQDVQADPVMQRVWVRVGRCGDPSAPLILVPLRAGMAGSVAAPPNAFLAPPANPAATMAVHAGDAVTAVFVSSNVHMELDATANGQAAIGSPVEITLPRLGDEPAHRMRGVLRASRRVEVQP